MGGSDGRSVSAADVRAPGPKDRGRFALPFYVFGVWIAIRIGY